MADDNVEVVVTGPGTVVVTPVPTDSQFIEINNGTIGPRGPVGPAGPPGPGIDLEDIAYTHVQGVATNTWVIDHPLGFTPSVVAVDSAGNEQIGTVYYPSAGKIIISFGNAFSGTAYLS